MFDEAAKGFKFKIGDHLNHVGIPNLPLVVVGRILHECHGGIQREYVCSTISGDVGPHSHSYNESCLESRVDKIAKLNDDLKKWFATHANPEDVKPAAEPPKE